jgi:hypothetical protein
MNGLKKTREALLLVSGFIEPEQKGDIAVDQGY